MKNNNLKIELIDENMYLKNKLNFKKNITFGIEIEAEDIYPLRIIRMGKSNNILKEWKYKDDRSLKQDHSIELASPIFTDQKDSYNSIKKACKLLEQENANVNGNSSLQIHYGAEIFNENKEHLKEFYKLWALFEHVIYRYSYGKIGKPRETILTYAKPISNFLKNKLKEIENEKYDILNLSRLIGAEKSNAISFRYKEENNQLKIKTIEIRTINGTLDYIMIQNYINFFYNFINSISLNSYDKEMIDFLFKQYEISKYDFLNYNNVFLDDAVLLSNIIFNNEMDKQNFLKIYLKEDSKILSIQKNR